MKEHKNRYFLVLECASFLLFLLILYLWYLELQMLVIVFMTYVLFQAARALANLAAHGDSNNNNAAVGQEAGALEALVQLTQSPHEGVKQEAAGALWNLSFDDKNRESIAACGGVEALVLNTFNIVFIIYVFSTSPWGNLSLVSDFIYIRWHLQSPVQMHPQVCKRELLVLFGDYLSQKQTGATL